MSDQSPKRIRKRKWKRYGIAKHPLCLVWRKMIARCHSPKDKQFSAYGGRGISVCERWRNSFDNFVADMGDRPLGTSLDRRENEKGYSPENCRWATPTEQSRNTRSNRCLAFRGETKPVAAWAEQFGISDATILSRVDLLGWSVERAISTSVGGAQKRGNSLTVGGVTKKLSEWSEEIGLGREVLRRRLARGWTPEDSIRPGSFKNGQRRALP